MKNRFWLISAIVIPAALAFGGTVVAKTAKDAPDKVTIDACKKKKSGVEFDHKKHSGELKLACDKCHHTQKGLTAASADEVKTCASCHLTPEKADTPKCTESSSKKNPYHILCAACHKAEAKKDPAKKAIKSCKACHK